MGKESKIDHLIREMQEHRGEFREFRGGMEKEVKNTNDHLRAVSQKADTIREGLDAHKESSSAHGAGATGRTVSRIVSVVSLIVAIAALMGLGHRANNARSNNASAEAR